MSTLEWRERPLTEHPATETCSVLLHYRMRGFDGYMQGAWVKEQWNTCHDDLRLGDAVGWLPMPMLPKEATP